ncbi:Relaxase/Mobilisation nuclease domain-containing protein [Marinobacter sp. LV10R510-11A]|uniref:relaxase/mobilization nuclease domain-containing protein n=1 Tax=Marinobacter sp. LV10R510-11A TaxID=1415568 RepID=UPI000BC05819|nr:relaxase/mobilization nuclease domain-containing protein [Marinobacter sp. LV10R510-11A]SOB75319.1 Relaxase/Mobilisation nuclease domain-containing protein [Marinobacter sp. LV10R510-11A]
MIHKKKEFDSSAYGRLNYAAGGIGHEHTIESLGFIKGTMTSDLKFIDQPAQAQEPEPMFIIEGIDDILNAIPEVTASSGSSSANSGNSSVTKGKTAASAPAVDFSDLDNEFEAAASMHCGKGEKLFGHYIISLAPGETLTPEQWGEVLKEYMDSMGYDEFCKYCGFIHRETSSEHLHILTCRVQLKPGGPLVDGSNDYAKGMEAMRKLEKRFGLQIVANPEDSWGVDIKKEQFKYLGGNREEANEAMLNGPRKDWAAVIRARVNEAWGKQKPRNMGELVSALRAVGVDVKVRTNKAGEPEGISYQAHGSKAWISGSKVKATRLTWRNLIEKEGITYDLHKHNAALGLPPAPGTLVRADAFQPINRIQFAALKRSKIKVRLYKRGKVHHVRFGFEQLLKSGKERHEEMMHDQMFKLVRDLLALLFGTDRGWAAPATQTRDNEVPDGMDLIQDDTDPDQAWTILASDKPDRKELEKIKIETSEMILAEHGEWIKPKISGDGDTLDNDMDLNL